MAITTFATLFAVMADPSNLNLSLRLAEQFPDSHIEIRPGQWFIAGSGTAIEISNKLQITPGAESGSAVIVAVSGYYGRASSQVWEWVAAKIGKPTSV